MKVLFIGGTGLISTETTKYLVERGHDVTHFNRGKTEVQIPESVSVIHGDRTNYAEFEKRMSEVGPFDCVVDMVCFLPEEAKSAIRAFRGRTEHYIFCSTSAVYTMPAVSYPILEDNTREAIGPYGINKALCEDIFMAAHDAKDFAVTIIRPGMVYGQSRRLAGFIGTFGWSTDFVDRIRKGKPIIVAGNGSGFWDCCHAEDEGRAFANAVGRTRTYGNSYHVTGLEAFTWNQYFRQLAEAIGAPEPKLVHIPTDLLNRVLPRELPALMNNDAHYLFDNSKAIHDLDYEYTITWKDGARRTVDWLDANGLIVDSDSNPLEDRVISAWERLGAEMQQELADLKNPAS